MLANIREKLQRPTVLVALREKLQGPSVVCPFCMGENRAVKELPACLICKAPLSDIYVANVRQHPPFFVQMVGWTGVGKTIFLYGLTFVLTQMHRIWDGYIPIPATDITAEYMETVKKHTTNLKMPLPDRTQRQLQDAYVMILRGLPRWGGRTLVTRDCPGEAFEKMEYDLSYVPYLLHAPTPLVLISLPDLRKSQAQTLRLVTNYTNTLLKNKALSGKPRRRMIVVLTKADDEECALPEHLHEYLIDDPIWKNVNPENAGLSVFWDAAQLAAYIEQLERLSTALRKWIRDEGMDDGFIGLAEAHFDLVFTLVSSTGSPPVIKETPEGTQQQLKTTWAPKRVLDPYFWALEAQSRL